ncbi:hypothetical protein ACIBQ6_29270 [Nonomuraea sp. NPDC049655]|uniref:hypothetical protein n=1 Tax=Nonomuraea sp. NPDC049655 TaxID=3364355 RepID=UPI0037AE2A10
MRWLARGEGQLPAGEGRTGDGRPAEHPLARWTVSQALHLVCPGPAGDPDVRRRPDGAAQAWRDGRPLPVGISITSRAGWAVCLLGLEPGAVGCDLQLVEPRGPGFVADRFTRQEQRIAGDDPLLGSLLWSAKESAAQVLRRAEHRALEVSLGCGRPRDGWSGLTVRAGGRGVAHGWWRRFGPLVLTVAADRPTPPPRGLEEPSALASAQSSVSSPVGSYAGCAAGAG